VSEAAVDSSAVYAILLREPDALRFDAAIRACEPVMSLATRVEISCVARRRLGPAGEAEIPTHSEWMLHAQKAMPGDAAVLRIRT
jgi:uncharacterized protein with PIN domain